MAKFTGTNAEFRRYIGPRLRNLVQQITRRHRDAIGSCEHCGATSELESAHVRGRDRNEIIDLVLAPYTLEGVAEVDLVAFEEAFKAEHDPLEKSILILCRSCHRTYDSPISDAARPPQKSVHSPASLPSQNTDGMLPISFEPSDPAEFKRFLLLRKKAQIVTYYENGVVEKREWNARRFSASSNVRGNLRSRPEFRPGEWQRRGIVKVHVCVEKDA
jgi:hypothetical protein